MDNRHVKEYSELGVTVIENALPLDIANPARDRFLSAEYDHIQQERKRYFGQTLNSDNAELPAWGEIYTADFWRSQFLEKSEYIRDLFTGSISPILEKVTLKTITEIEFRAYRMTAGGHFRVHIDDYLGEVGFIWYLSKGWKWDWGGLLITIDNNSISTTLPKFNQLAIVNHLSRLPHLVTEVSKNALEPRYMLVGFGV